jgi:hypothetical protein
VRSTPNPLRILGLFRILAGIWFIATGIATLRQYSDLMPQAARLFGQDIGATDAPIRALLVLITAPVVIVIGLVLVAKGWRWMRRLPLPLDAPAAIERDEVIATLRHRRLLAYTDGPAKHYWLLRRWLADELLQMTWWRREIVAQGVGTFLRSCGLALAVAICWLAVSQLIANDLFGPFPAGFVVVLPFATAIWAGLALLLVGSNRLRIESVEFPRPTLVESGGEMVAEEIIESPPRLLYWEPPGLGLALGATGVAVQCLMLSWWSLSYIGYPLLATSIIRDSGSLAGGILFFVLGHRMVIAAAELLLRVQYDSTLVLIDEADNGIVARAAGVRTESRGPGGPRRVIAAVGGTHVRESAEKLVRSFSLPSPPRSP